MTLLTQRLIDTIAVFRSQNVPYNTSTDATGLWHTIKADARFADDLSDGWTSFNKAHLSAIRATFCWSVLLTSSKHAQSLAVKSDATRQSDQRVLNVEMS